MSDVQRYGFRWGNLVVERLASFAARIYGDDRTRVLRIKTDQSSIEVYVSPGGRSIRVFKKGRELT
jgi:hypothetical protein